MPIPLQTLYAELVETSWTGALAELLAAGGTPYTREVRGRKYWYWQPATNGGERGSARYIGPDTPEVRGRIAGLRDVAMVKRERASLVAALRAARVPVPDALTGAVLGSLAAAGAFRLRAVVIGSVAFQCYPPLLGVRLGAALSRTGDVDIGQFHSIAVAVDDEMEQDFLSALRQVDRRFEAIPAPMDGRQTLRYAVRAGSQELFSVDVLSPLRGRDRPTITHLKALHAQAHLLRLLDFLLYQEVAAVALHGPGIPINVPAPERYALHKLLVAQMRIAIPASQAKARKDLAQATALIRVLAQDRPMELNAAWAELRARGPSWRAKADRSVRLLPEDARTLMTGLAEEEDARPARDL